MFWSLSLTLLLLELALLFVRLLELGLVAAGCRWPLGISGGG